MNRSNRDNRGVHAGTDAAVNVLAVAVRHPHLGAAPHNAFPAAGVQGELSRDGVDAALDDSDLGPVVDRTHDSRLGVDLRPVATRRSSRDISHVHV